MSITSERLVALRDEPDASMRQVAAAACALMFHHESDVGRVALEVCAQILSDRSGERMRQPGVAA